MTMKKAIKNLGLSTKKKYSFKIAGCQHQIRRPLDPKQNDDWLKSFYLN